MRANFRPRLGLVLIAALACARAATVSAQLIGPIEGGAGVFVWTSDPSPTVRELAEAWAPVLWFADYEPLFELATTDEMPARLPTDLGPPPEMAVVHFRATVVTERGGPGFLSSWGLSTQDTDPSVYTPATDELHLGRVDLIRLQYLFYFTEDVGGGGHDHDLEIAEMWVRVRDLTQGTFMLHLERVVGYAHGHKGFANKLTVGGPPLNPVALPITLLIERGKHAPSPDRTADGDFTPGFDVNDMVSDAWGIRDVFGSNWLGTRAYSSWMTLPRTAGRMAYLYGTSRPTFAGASGTWQYQLRDFRRAATASTASPDLHVYLDYHDFDQVPQDGPNRFLVLWDYIGAGARFDVDLGPAAYLSVMTADLPLVGGHPMLQGFFGATWSGNHPWFGLSGFYSPSVAGFVSLYGGATWVECHACSNRRQIGPEAGIKLRIPIPHPPAPDFVGLRLGLRYTGFKQLGAPRFLIELGLATP